MKKVVALKNALQKLIRKKYLFVEELGNATKITLGLHYGTEWGSPGRRF